MGADWTKETPVEDVSRSIAPLSISFINSGDDGVVYRLQVGDRAFALKLFKAAGGMDEFRALTFFGAQGAKDIMKSYIGKFHEDREEVSWILSEFIPSGPPFTARELNARGPSSLAEIARRHGIYVGGDAGGRVNSIYVDAGFVRTRTDMGAQMAGDERPQQQPSRDRPTQRLPPRGRV